MEETLYSRTYLTIVLTAGFIFITTNMMGTTMAQYCISLGGTRSLAGMIESCGSITAFLCRANWGSLADKTGRRFVFRIGLGLAASAALILFFTNSIPWLFVGRILFGAGLSGLSTANATMVADNIPQSRFSEGIAFYGVASILGQGLGPILALALFKHSFQWVMVGLIAVLGGAFACTSTVKYDEKALLKKDSAKRTGSFIEKKALPAASADFFVAMAFVSTTAFIPIMGKERGIPGVGLFFTFSAAALFLTRVVGAKLPSIIGEAKVMYGGVLFLMATFAILAFATTQPVVCLAGFLFSLGNGYVYPMLNAMAVRGVEPNRRGVATSTFMMSWDIGMTVGTTLWGFISGAFGFTVMYLVVVVCAAMIAVMYTLVVRPRMYKEKRYQ